MEGTSKGDSKKLEEKVLIVMAHRLEDLTMPIPIAKVAKCYKCENDCAISPATLQTIVVKTKKYQVICSKCAFKDEKFMKDAQYETFTPQQLAELAEIRERMQVTKGGAG